MSRGRKTKIDVFSTVIYSLFAQRILNRNVDIDEA